MVARIVTLDSRVTTPWPRSVGGCATQEGLIKSILDLSADVDRPWPVEPLT